jgi:hypothetical protein
MYDCKLIHKRRSHHQPYIPSHINLSLHHSPLHPKFSRRNLTFEIHLRIFPHDIAKPAIVLNEFAIHFHLIDLTLGHHHVGCAGHHAALELGVELGGLAEGFGLLHH